MHHKLGLWECVVNQEPRTRKRLWIRSLPLATLYPMNTVPESTTPPGRLARFDANPTPRPVHPSERAQTTLHAMHAVCNIKHLRVLKQQGFSKVVNDGYTFFLSKQTHAHARYHTGDPAQAHGAGSRASEASRRNLGFRGAESPWYMKIEEERELETKNNPWTSYRHRDNKTA